jgi:hypothetical protein
MEHRNVMTKTELTDDLVTEALFAGGGILSDAARYLAERLGRRVSRQELADRVEASRILSAVKEIAHQRSFDEAIAKCRRAQREKRSAAMRASWARRRGQGGGNGPDPADSLTRPNARTRARLSWGNVRAAADQRICMARTRQGFPCTRKVVPGKKRCPNHGGLSTGAKTAAGKARIVAAQRAYWQRVRAQRAAEP